MPKNHNKNRNDNHKFHHGHHGHNHHHNHGNKIQTAVHIINLASSNRNHHHKQQNHFIIIQKPRKGSDLRCLRIFCGIFFGIIEMVLGILILASSPQDDDAIDGGVGLLVVGFVQCCVCLCPKQQKTEKTGYRRQID
ncbi:hypothetical protein pb186bvf_007277 [Paramecium bursaria]